MSESDSTVARAISSRSAPPHPHIPTIRTRGARWVDVDPSMTRGDERARSNRDPRAHPQRRARSAAPVKTMARTKTKTGRRCGHKEQRAAGWGLQARDPLRPGDTVSRPVEGEGGGASSRGRGSTGSGEFEEIPHVVRRVIRDRRRRGTKERKRDRKPPPSASRDRELLGTRTGMVRSAGSF
jgi:hypothetical protein